MSSQQLRREKTIPVSVLEPLEPRRLLSADVVIQWNETMIEMCRSVRPGIGPTVAARDMAVMDVAIYDAVNGISHRNQPYLVPATGPRGASKSAAAASAAYETLLSMFPDQK